MQSKIFTLIANHQLILPHIIPIKLSVLVEDLLQDLTITQALRKCTFIIRFTFICLDTVFVSPVSEFKYDCIIGKKCYIYLPSVSLETKTHRCNYIFGKDHHVDTEHIFLASYFPIIISVPKLRANFRLLRGSWMSLG